MASATRDFLGHHVVSGGGYFSGADDHGARTARSRRTCLCAARRAGGGGVWQHGRRVCGRLRMIQNGWSWFGHQGFTFLDLGRFWQILLTVGLFFWVVILFRGLRNRLRNEYMGNLPWLFFFAALAIPAFYAGGLLVRNDSTFTTTDFWRFWVVHLWVEDFLELFTTVMVAYIFVLLGVVNQR